MYFLQGSEALKGATGPKGDTGSLVEAYSYAVNTGDVDVTGYNGVTFYPIPLNEITSNIINYNSTGKYFDISSSGTGIYECNYTISTLNAGAILVGLKADDILIPNTIMGNYNTNFISNSNLITASNTIKLVNLNTSDLTLTESDLPNTIPITLETSNNLIGTFSTSRPTGINISLNNCLSGGNIYVSIQYITTDTSASRITNITDVFGNVYTRILFQASNSFTYAGFGRYTTSEIWGAYNVSAPNPNNTITVTTNTTTEMLYINIQAVEYLYSLNAPPTSISTIGNNQTIDILIPSNPNGLALLSIANYNGTRTSSSNITSNLGTFIFNVPDSWTSFILNYMPAVLLAIPTTSSVQICTLTTSTGASNIRWAVTGIILSQLPNTSINNVNMSVKLLRNL